MTNLIRLTLIVFVRDLQIGIGSREASINEMITW